MNLARGKEGLLIVTGKKVANRGTAIPHLPVVLLSWHFQLLCQPEAGDLPSDKSLEGQW